MSSDVYTCFGRVWPATIETQFVLSNNKKWNAKHWFIWIKVWIVLLWISTGRLNTPIAWSQSYLMSSPPPWWLWGPSPLEQTRISPPRRPVTAAWWKISTKTIQMRGVCRRNVEGHYSHETLQAAKAIRNLINWLVVSNISYFPFHIWDVILPIDEVIFFKMVIAPPTRYDQQIIKYYHLVI